MTFDHELYLISLQNDTNAMGDPIQVPVKRAVLCDWKSITRSEHYQAAAHGLRPEIVFVVNRHEYQGEREVEFEGRRYQVMRVWAPKQAQGLGDFENIELVCTGLVGIEHGVPKPQRGA